MCDFYGLVFICFYIVMFIKLLKNKYNGNYSFIIAVYFLSVIRIIRLSIIKKNYQT